MSARLAWDAMSEKVKEQIITDHCPDDFGLKNTELADGECEVCWEEAVKRG